MSDLKEYQVLVDGRVEHRLSVHRPDGCSMGCPGIPMAYVDGVFERRVLLCGPHVALWRAQFGTEGLQYFKERRK